MLINSKYKFTNTKSRSVYEIISEDGEMSRRDILYVIKQVCQIEDIVQYGEFIHPRNIMINTNGVVTLVKSELPFSTREAYIPPENDRFDTIKPSAIVYALGITMLFMATGNERKTGLDSHQDDNQLFRLIQTCIDFDIKARLQDEKELLGEIRRSEGIFVKPMTTALSILLVSILVIGMIYLFQTGSKRGEKIGKELAYATGYEVGYEEGFDDAPGTGIEETPFDENNGNLVGNINANIGAFAVRSEDEIFFLHKGIICQMDPYTEKIQILAKEENANNLNYYKGWLYYCTDKGLMRIDPKSLKNEIVSDSKTGLLYIIDGVFYLDDISESGYLYRLDSVTGAYKQLNGIVDFHCFNVSKDRIYYSDANQNYTLYSCNLDGSDNRAINSNSCEWYSIYGDKIYAYSAVYKDVEQKVLSNSTSFFIRMDLDGAGIERLSNLPAYYINVTDAGIFYVAGENKSLEWLSHDGRFRYRILPENVGPFNIVGRWIFYQNLEDDGNLWRVRINGKGNEKVTL